MLSWPLDGVFSASMVEFSSFLPFCLSAFPPFLKNCAKFSLIINTLNNFILEIFGESLVIWVPKSYLCVPLRKGGHSDIQF
jgi:hypothetical protein